MSIKISDGRFDIDWTIGFGWFTLDMPVLTDGLDILHEDMDPEEALSLARATVSSDAPVWFRQVAMCAESLRNIFTGS